MSSRKVVFLLIVGAAGGCLGNFDAEGDGRVAVTEEDCSASERFCPGPCPSDPGSCVPATRSCEIAPTAEMCAGDGTSPCESASPDSFCAPFGPATGCPAGTEAIAELSCSEPGGPVGEEICCVPDRSTSETECASIGGSCAPYGPVSEGFGCPEGTVGNAASCSVAGGPVLEEVCCLPEGSDCRASGCPDGRRCMGCSAGWECVPDGATC